jgi:transposase
MPAPLSPDLRQRIIETYTRGGVSMPAPAARFAVSLGSVQRFVRRHRSGADLAPTVRATPLSRRLVQPEHERVIETWIAQAPSLTQRTMASRLTALVGRVVSQQTAGDALRRMGYTYKKNGYVRLSN